MSCAGLCIELSSAADILTVRMVRCLMEKNTVFLLSISELRF